MTREELKDNICGMTHDDMFEYIYDLENRTCRNCSNYLQNISKYGEHRGECSLAIVQERDLDTVKITFGCNEFEVKIVSTDTKSPQQD